ncbi:hypothetical protein GJ496_010930 [Pomphorhynchus laevis]|nr:hypothetical protein GJ496_010930 [Pomphorhynchus laevis]
MPVWPYNNQNVYQHQAVQPNAQYLPMQQSTRNDRHGWAQFIASQTNHRPYIPQMYNNHIPPYNHQQIPTYNADNPYQPANYSAHHQQQSQSIQQSTCSDEKQLFCVDRVGLEHNKPPAFTQRYKVALPDNEEKACLQPSSSSNRKSACFNCMETDHMISDCPHPRNQDRIRQNRQAFLENSGSGGHTSCNGGHERYHGSSGDRKMMKGGISAARRLGKYANIVPAQYTNELRNALGLNDQQLPSFIYRMRELGYPPGWLQECLVYRNVSEGAKEEYDFDRLISFPGFNQAPDELILNESELYGTPEYSEEMFGKDSFIQSLQNSGCIAMSTTADADDQGDPMELDEEDTCYETCDKPVIQKANNLLKEKEEIDSSDDKSADEIVDEVVDENADDNNDLIDLDKLSNWTESFLSRENIGDSIEESDCTPLALSDDKLNFKMPTVDKFADGINAHRFYENLPGVVGNFARIMETVKNVKKKEI